MSDYHEFMKTVLGSSGPGASEAVAAAGAKRFKGAGSLGTMATIFALGVVAGALLISLVR